MANRAAGKGYENEDNYENIRFKFIGIENIHVMRSSLQKLLEGGCSPGRGFSYPSGQNFLLNIQMFLAQMCSDGSKVSILLCLLHSGGWKY